jgi:hypothetical protein
MVILSVPEPQRDLLNNVIKTLSGAVGIHWGVEKNKKEQRKKHYFI